MPVLTVDDPTPWPLRRVTVAGTSGSGKTTLAQAISARLGLPHTELDSLYHGTGWVPRPEFADDVQAVLAGERWVVEWQYAAARTLAADRADLLVWLDVPVATVMRQVVVRTIRRRWTREVMWNDNREDSLLDALRRGGIIRWAWNTRHTTARRVTEELAETHPELPVLRLRSRAEIRRWLDALPRR